VTPYLIINGAAAAIDFYKKAFGATELFRMPDPGGKVAHAEMQVGDSRIMLADEFPERGFRGPQALGGSAVGMHLYVDDVDAIMRQALAGGAKEMEPVSDKFYGDRSGSVVDPFGHLWTISTHKEDLSEAEVGRRFQELEKKAGQSR
jgi:PhnB protein